MIKITKIEKGASWASCEIYTKGRTHVGTVWSGDRQEPSEAKAMQNALDIQRALNCHDDLVAALDSMVELFDHNGLFGLIAGAKKHGWTQDHLQERINACVTAKAALAKAKA